MRHLLILGPSDLALAWNQEGEEGWKPVKPMFLKGQERKVGKERKEIRGVRAFAWILSTEV